LNAKPDSGEICAALAEHVGMWMYPTCLIPRSRGYNVIVSIKDRKENIMSVPDQEDRLMQLAEDWYEHLVREGWPKNDWETWSEARTRAKDEWEKGYEG